jgi:AcrR family transcriptional regulator
VQEILGRANLGRATFYAHYRDKQDLLLDTFAALRGVFHAQHTDERGVDHLSLRFFRHAAGQRRLYRAMVGKESGALLHTYARRLLSDELRDHLGQLAARGEPRAVPIEVAVEYLVSTLLGLLSWWLDHDLPYPPEQMDAMFRRLALPGLAEVFGFSLEDS